MLFGIQNFLSIPIQFLILKRVKVITDRGNPFLAIRTIILHWITSILSS
ncbi:Uncharacterised protein [Vibrio cholerae]|uniref:Uncharacterized protein n=1 Tax=Vibrio cholerae TaxID=666 RepID=A0A655QSN2_VIBCL|nr:Uncharacterised protein [Vibrio cholerae]